NIGMSKKASPSERTVTSLPADLRSATSWLMRMDPACEIPSTIRVIGMSLLGGASDPAGVPFEPFMEGEDPSLQLRLVGTHEQEPRELVVAHLHRVVVGAGAAARPVLEHEALLALGRDRLEAPVARRDEQAPCELSPEPLRGVAHADGARPEELRSQPLELHV